MEKNYTLQKPESSSAKNPHWDYTASQNQCRPATCDGHRQTNERFKETPSDSKNYQNSNDRQFTSSTSGYGFFHKSPSNNRETSNFQEYKGTR